MTTPLEVEVEIIGGSELAATLEKAEQKFSDLSRYFQRLGKFLTGFYSTFPFVTQGGIYGQPWAALSETYAERKAEQYRGRGILVATGEMQEGFRDDPDSHSVRVFNEIDHFQWHQTGTSKMPQRIIMQLEDRQEKYINDSLTEYAEEALGG